jgi:excisionase family DNA binding protein
MNPSHPTPISISVRDAAALTSISEYEIRAAINKGHLKARRLGRRLLILTDDVRAWLDTLEQVVESETA